MSNVIYPKLWLNNGLSRDEKAALMVSPDRRDRRIAAADSIVGNAGAVRRLCRDILGKPTGD